MGCNFTEPFDHSLPVHHGGMQVLLRDWPDECLWAQLQYERWQKGRNPQYTNTAYLTNLENEWAGRAICSRCYRDIDTGLDKRMSELETQAQNARGKLVRIRRVITVTPDAELRPKLMSILDEQ
jgi:hypothetical protein